MPNSLLEYQGNVGLGQGSNPGIAVISPESRNLNLINETANRMMLMNHQNNVSLFQQKIADRDELYTQLQKGQIVVGDLNEKDKSAWEQAKKVQSDAFYEMAQNGGITNKEAYRKYIQATTNLKETSTHLQARKIGIDQYNADIAKEPIQAKKEELIRQRDRQLEKDSAAMVDPYQTSLDLDLDNIRENISKGAIAGTGVPSTVTSQSVRTTSTPGKPDKTVTFQKTVPVKATKGSSQPITTVAGQQAQGGAIPTQQGQIIYKGGLPYSVTTQHVDFNKLKDNAQNIFLEKSGAGAEQLSKFYDMFTDPSTISHEEIKPTYDNMVKRSEEYNRARGFVPQPDGSMLAEDLANGAVDVKKLINAFNVPPDPKTGKRNINMSKPELAAIFTLAGMDNYATQTETLLKDQAELSLKDKQISGNLKIQAQNAASLAALRRAQIAKLNKAIEGKTALEQKQEFDKYWTSNGASILNSKTAFGGTMGIIPAGSIPYEKSRPVYTQDANGSPKLLKPIDGSPIYDTYKYDAKGNLTGKSKVIGYQGGHYESQFYNKSTGQTIDVNNIQDAFKKAKGGDPSLTEEQFLINLGDAGINYRLIGDNGTSANIDDNGNNLRILNNKFTTKGERQPIENDADVFEQSNEE